MSDIELRELQRKADLGDDTARKALYRAKRRVGILPTWDEIVKHFADIIFAAEGPSKSKSGQVKIHVDSCIDEKEPGILIELGTYDIGHWGSWAEIGPFFTFAEAQKAFADKVDKAEQEVERFNKEEEDNGSTENNICLFCTRRLSGSESLRCSHCQYTFYDCPDCGSIYEEETDAGDCCVE